MTRPVTDKIPREFQLVTIECLKRSRNTRGNINDGSFEIYTCIGWFKRQILKDLKRRQDSKDLEIQRLTKNAVDEEVMSLDG